jgi:DNA adenine methylase
MRDLTSPTTEPAPFLRWAGSKRKLFPKLLPFWSPEYSRYIEPFAGSAALFFAIRPKRAILGDTNASLIQALTRVRNDPRRVYQKLRRFPLGKQSYYDLRALDPDSFSPDERAARFIFLNRFCFNGLYRTNQSGQFNVPFSSSRTGGLPSLDQIVAAAELLKVAKLKCEDFESLIVRVARAGDFVYLDPPYAVGNRRIFRQYGPHEFGTGDLDRLRRILTVLSKRGAHFVLSYALCKEALQAFSDWSLKRVYTQRNISGFAMHRRRAAELLVSNIPERLRVDLRKSTGTARSG